MMTESDTIQNIPTPRTRERLAADLRGLGLTTGMTVIVHSSLSSLGWVSGGSVAVVQALMDVLTSFHLGEYRVPGGKRLKQAAPIVENGQRVWKTIDDLDWDADCFEEMA